MKLVRNYKAQFTRSRVNVAPVAAPAEVVESTPTATPVAPVADKAPAPEAVEIELTTEEKSTTNADLYAKLIKLRPDTEVKSGDKKAVIAKALREASAVVE